MGTDFVVRRADPAAVIAAMAALPARFPGVDVDGDDDAAWDVSVRSFSRIAEVDRTDAMVKVSGADEAGIVVAWLAATIASLAGAADVWDPALGRPLSDAPDWDDVQLLIRAWEVEREGPGGGEGEENARRFVAYLVEHDQIELAAAPRDLYARVAEVLDGPERGRVARLEKLLLGHPGVEEVFGDADSLGDLVGAWG